MTTAELPPPEEAHPPTFDHTTFRTHRPAVDDSLLRYFPVFMMVGVLLVLVGLIPYPRSREGEVWAVGSLFIVLTLLGWALKWWRAPSWLWLAAPFLYLVDVVILRDAQGGGGSGLAPAFILPVIWIAFYGRRTQVIFGLVAQAAALLIPIIFIGPPSYPWTEWRGVVTILVVSAAVGFAILTTVAWEQANARDIVRQAEEVRRSGEDAEIARERLVSLLRAATQTAIIGCNSAGTVTFFSAGAERMFGEVAGDVVGQRQVLNFFDEDELGHRDSPVRAITDVSSERFATISPPRGTATVDPENPLSSPSDEAHRVRDAVWTFRRRDGAKGKMSVVVTQNLSEGRLGGYVMVASDVTEKEMLATERGRLLAIDHEITQVLVEQNDHLRELTRMKDEIVTTVSHEVRTPLTSIRGYIELILEGLPEDISDEHVKMLRTIERNATQLLRVADDLLADPALGRDLRVSFVDLDLAVLVREVRDVVAASSLERDQSLTVIADTPVHVKGDPARLHQLLSNLLANAVKFAPHGGRIVIEVTPLGPFARIDVHDNGPGVPPAEREHLFERFYRMASSSDLGIPGSGLGLAIAKAVVDAHNGTIHVVDVPGWETTFRIHLPAIEADQAAPSSGAPSMWQRASHATSRGTPEKSPIPAP